MDALAAKAAQALTDATAGLSTTETERLAGATSLTLALEDAGSWTLRWDQATSRPQLINGEEDGAIKVTTTTTTLVALASKKLSPFTALVHGKLKLGDGAQQHARRRGSRASTKLNSRPKRWRTPVNRR